MKVFLTTTKLKKTAWEGKGWWVEAQYGMQTCRSGEDDMRSHVALLFEDRPFQMRTAPGGSSRSARGAATVSYDFTSRPFSGFTRIEDSKSWYSQFKDPQVDVYEIRSRDPDFAAKAHAVATRWAEAPPPYEDSFKWNAWIVPFWPYPGASLDGRPRMQRGTNCVGATMSVLEEAAGEPLGLGWQFESYLPGKLPAELQRLGVLGEKVRTFTVGRETMPLLMSR